MAVVNWVAVGSFMTGIAAIATAAMAIATFRAARDTKDMATATLREAVAVEKQLSQAAAQVRIADEALRANVQPWLTWKASWNSADLDERSYGYSTTAYLSGEHSGVGIKDTGNGLEGYLLVRNVGNGLALINTADSWVLGETDQNEIDQRYVTLSTQMPVMPTDQVIQLGFKISPVSAAWTALTLDSFARRPASHGHFSIDVTYTDAVRSSPTLARFKIASRAGGQDDWVVYRIEYYSGDDPEPTLSVAVQ